MPYRSILAEVYIFLLLVWMGWLCLTLEGTALQWAFNEKGVIERVQAVQFFVAGLATFAAFLVGSIAEERWVSILFAFALLWGSNRERDSRWEDLELDWAFDTLRVVIAAPIAAIVLCRHSECLTGWRNGVGRMSHRLFVGGVCFYLAGQGLGRLMKELGATRPLKRLSEEGLELLGGAFLALAAVELLFEVLAARKAGRRTGMPGG